MSWLAGIRIKMIRDRRTLLEALAGDIEDAWVAASRLTELKDVEGPIAGLEHRTRARSGVIRGLGATGDARAVPVLLKELWGKDGITAQVALGQIGDPGAVFDICRFVVLGGGERAHRGAALDLAKRLNSAAVPNALAACCTPEAFLVITRLADTPDAEPRFGGWEREVLGHLLSQFRKVGTPLDLITGILSHLEKEPSVVLHALAYVADAKAVPKLCEFAIKSFNHPTARRALEMAESLDSAAVPSALAAAFTPHTLLTLAKSSASSEVGRDVLVRMAGLIPPANVIISGNFMGIIEGRSNILHCELSNRSQGPAMDITVRWCSPDLPSTREMKIVVQDVDLPDQGDSEQFDVSIAPEMAGEVRLNWEIDYWDVTGKVEQTKTERVRIDPASSNPQVVIEGDVLQGSIKQSGDGVAYVGGARQISSEGQTARVRFCSGCGSELSRDATGRFCPFCGIELSI